MNWLLIAVLLILAVSTALGYRRGILKILYSIVSWVLVLAFVSYAAPNIKIYLQENTLLYEKITAKCEETIRNSVNERIAQIGENAGDDWAGRLEKNALLEDLGIHIPDRVVEQLLEKLGKNTDEVLEASGAYTAIAKGLADFAAEGIAFIIALAAAWILIYFVSHLFGGAFKIPVIKGVNHSLGMFAGAVYGLLLVWLLFYIIALSSTGSSGQALVSYIYDNSFLTYLYENNPILVFVMRHF